MRVLVDARTVFAAQRRGTGKNLVDLYSTLAVRRPTWEFVMAHLRPAENPFADYANIRTKQMDAPGDRYDTWENIRLPIFALMRGADVVHCPANSAPRVSITPVVATIHDLIAFDAEPLVGTLRWRRRVRRAAASATHIVTPSEFSRQAIVARLGVPPERITVNAWAPDRKLSRVEDAAQQAEAAGKYGVPRGKQYVLSFGAADPRKNSRRILDAWSRVPVTARQDVVLLMVGFQKEILGDAREIAASACPDGSAIIGPFAAEDDMNALISGALCLCYPSLSEGFGLPVLDGFACETPVITSTTTSLPEVAGDAAILVDPTSTAAVSDALQLLLTCPDERARLIEAGRERVAGFTWDRCADTIAGVFERAAGRR